MAPLVGVKWPAISGYREIFGRGRRIGIKRIAEEVNVVRRVVWAARRL